jgi:hypothetical protein
MSGLEFDVEKVALAVLAHIEEHGTVIRPLLTPKTLAERLGCSERQARKLIGGENPTIPSFLIDGGRRIDPREVDRYVEQQKAKAS